MTRLAQKFWRWINVEASGIQVPYLVCLFLVIEFPILFLIAMVMDFVGVTPSAIGDGTVPMLDWRFVWFLFQVAWLEEVLFRFPLFFVVRVHGTSVVVFYYVIAISAMFGLLHGDVAHIFIQGFGGLLLSTLFLKCGGFQGKLFKPLLTTFSCHFVFNGIITLVLIMGGEYYF